jgi:hypothetical protein
MKKVTVTCDRCKEKLSEADKVIDYGNAYNKSWIVNGDNRWPSEGFHFCSDCFNLVTIAIVKVLSNPNKE